MSSEAQIQARADRLDDAEYDSLKKSLHGIAARLDRLPIGSWHWKLLWLFGGAMFLDNSICISAVVLSLHFWRTVGQPLN